MCLVAVTVTQAQMMWVVGQDCVAFVGSKTCCIVDFHDTASVCGCGCGWEREREREASAIPVIFG